MGSYISLRPKEVMEGSEREDEIEEKDNKSDINAEEISNDNNQNLQENKIEDFLSRYHLKPLDQDTYQGIAKDSHECYLLKKFSQDMTIKELELMKTLSHPNYIKLHSFEKDKHQVLYGIYEYELCGYEGLEDRVVMEGNLNEYHGVIIMKQICSVVEYLHAKNLFHLDLKLANILIPKGRDAPIKLCDLGWALTDHKGSMGTPNFVAPELLTGEALATIKVDIWSIGIICYIILCGYPPFTGTNGVKLIKSIRKDPVKFEMELSDLSKQFIQLCLEKKPDDRPFASDLLKLPWMTEKQENANQSIVDPETLNLFVQPRHQYPPVLNEDGATYGIRFCDLVSLLNSYATILNQPMTREKLPGCKPLYGGLLAHHLREYFVKENIYPPTDPMTKDLFIKCDKVHVAISYVWKLPLLGLLDLLRGDMRRRPVHDDDVVWLDVLVIDQNAPDITKALEVSKYVYERSERHFVLTISCFDRTWCLYEMYLRLMSSECDANISRSELIELRTIGGHEDEKDREKTLREMGSRNMLRDMQAFLAEDREAVRTRILNTTTESRFNSMMRAIYADFAYRRRCSSLMQILICYYLGGQVSDPVLLERYLAGETIDIHSSGLHIIEFPSGDTHISSRLLPDLSGFTSPEPR